MFEFEKKWLTLLLESTIPSDKWPDCDGFLGELYGSASPLYRFGLRFATWFFIWSPLFVFQPPLHKQSEVGRASFLRSMNQSKVYLFRQMLVAVKTTACFAYFESEEVRYETN